MGRLGIDAKTHFKYLSNYALELSPRYKLGNMGTTRNWGGIRSLLPELFSDGHKI